MGLRWFKCLTISTSTALASVAGAETYTFTHAGNDANWSNPLNWEGGIIPVAASDSTIYGGGINDLGENFDVGSIIGYWTTNFLSQNSQSLRVHHRIENIITSAPMSTSGDVSIVSDIWMDLGLVTINGPLNTTGAIRMAMTGESSLHVNTDSHLEAYVSHLQLNSLTGGGIFDLMGDVEMVGSAPADLTLGTLELGSNQFLPDGPGSGTLSIDGDLKLGAWKIQGYSIYPTGDEIDRINVTGQLDLTQATITSDSIAYALGADPNATHVVIGSYGNRIGSFPETSIQYGYWGDQFDATIVYTSGENAGPGEIWIVLPEPTTALTLAILIPLTLRGPR